MKTSYLILLMLIAYLTVGCRPENTAKTDEQPAISSPPASSSMAESAPPSMAEAPVPAVDISSLAIKIDPVCKMSLEEYPATATAEHDGKSYGFCSEFCKKKFVADPAKLLARLKPLSTPSTEQP